MLIAKQSPDRATKKRSFVCCFSEHLDFKQSGTACSHRKHSHYTQELPHKATEICPSPGQGSFFFYRLPNRSLYPVGSEGFSVGNFLDSLLFFMFYPNRDASSESRLRSNPQRRSATRNCSSSFSSSASVLFERSTITQLRPAFFQNHLAGFFCPRQEKALRRLLCFRPISYGQKA